MKLFSVTILLRWSCLHASFLRTSLKPTSLRAISSDGNITEGVPQNVAWRIAPELKADGAVCGQRWKTDVFISRLTTSAEMKDPSARSLLSRFKIPFAMHRKYWEYIFMLKILDAIPLPTKAVGFAVGQEPTVSYFASKNVHVTATDLPPESRHAIGWGNTDQLMTDKQAMNKNGLASQAQMDEYVHQEYIDMNTVETSNVWDQRGTYDFVWSICSVEHVGSIRKALTFMEKSLELLKPGGTLLHTTEFNLEHLEHTLDHSVSVIFRKKDIDAFLQCAKHKGYIVSDACYDPGNGPIDNEIDTPPYFENNSQQHLRLEILGHISTCVGIVVRRPQHHIDGGNSCHEFWDPLNLA